MIDAVLQELYVAQVMAKQIFEDFAAALDPAAKKRDITKLSSLPDDFLREEFRAGPQQVEALRHDPHARDYFYNLENGRIAGDALDKRHAMLKSECDVLGLCDAIHEFYTTRNEPIPEDLRDHSRDMVKQSEKRVSAFILDLDAVLDDAEEDSHDLTSGVQTLRTAKKGEYLDRLRKGLDARTMREHSLNMLAAEYCNLAHNYFVSAGLNAAVQILRLEAEPASFGGDDHQVLFKAMQNDMKHAATAINFAKQASPENAPEKNSQLAAGYGTQRPS